MYCAYDDRPTMQNVVWSSAGPKCTEFHRFNTKIMKENCMGNVIRPVLDSPSMTVSDSSNSC